MIEEDSPAIYWPWDSWLTGVRHCIVGLRGARTVKGLDFQHAVLLMGPELYDSTQTPFKGVSRSVYESRKHLRIPFTRARDSLTVLLVKDYKSGEQKAKAVAKSRSVFARHTYG